MKKITNIIFKLLKIISYLWITIFSIAMFTLSFTDGQYHLGQRILLLVILNIIPVAFVVWRFKADKEIRLEKLKLKLEHKKEEQAIRDQLKEISDSNEKIETKILQDNKGYEKKKGNVIKKTVIVSIIILFLIVIGQVLYPTFKVKSLAKSQIESVLKAPSTAKFTGVNVKKIPSDDRTVYVVTGYVDSQNGFGASIRSNFKVSIAKTNNNYNIYDYSVN